MDKSVLIVDDSGYSRSLVRKAMESVGFVVVGEARNGVEALDKIQLLNPFLVTLDNIMPDMTGLEVLKAIRDQGIRSKVIMISAVGQQSAIEEAEALGVEGYLIKPFAEGSLLTIVNKIIHEE